MGLRFLPRPIARYDQSLLPVINENFQQLARLFANIPQEYIGASAPTDDLYVGKTWVDTSTYTIRVWDGTSWRPGDWINYTPTLLQSVNLTKTVATESAYDKRGKTVWFQGHYNITSAGSGGGHAITSGLPFTNIQGGNRCIGMGFYYNGAGNLTVICYCPTQFTIGFIRADTGAVLGLTDGTVAASGHALTFTVMYEATT